MIGESNTQRQIIGRTSLQYRTWGGIVNPMLMAVPMQSANAFSVMQVTNNYNAQCDYFRNSISSKVTQWTNRLNAKLLQNPCFTGYRQYGRELAWRYEQAEIIMGGKGTVKWTRSQVQEILQIDFKHKCSVRGYEGHHLKSVATHPEEQVNPNNIAICSHDDHFNKFHERNWRNQTDKPITENRDERLLKINKRRVGKNELSGVGIAAVIGFATGASIGFIVTLAQNGLSPESFKLAAIEGGKVGLEGMAFGVIGHIASRTLGEMATGAMTGLFANMGVELTENLMKACNMGVVGAVIIVTSSIYQYVRLRRAGCSTEECFARIGKQALVSVSSLAVMIMVQASFGSGPAAIVGISISAIALSYSLYQAYHNKLLAGKIQGYVIEKSYPSNIA